MNYNNYTKRFQYTKCFQLALIPQGKTAETITNKDLHGFDDAVYERIRRITPVIDSFLLNLIDKALDNFDFPFDQYDYNLSGIKTVNKGSDEYNTYKESIEIFENRLKSEIIDSIIKILPDDIKGKDLSKILSKPLFDTVLPDYVKNCKDASFDRADAIMNIESLKGASASILPRFRSRQTAMETWLPEREIENFMIYRRNMPLIKKLIENESIPEIHDFFTENPEFRSFISPNGFSLLMTQNALTGYNRMICGVSSENGIVSKGINMITNELNSINRQDKGYKGPFFKKLETLNKIPLAVTEKQYAISTIENDSDAQNHLYDTISKASSVRLEILSMLKNRVQDGLLIKGKNLHSISHLIFGEHNIISDAYAENYVKDLLSSLNGKKMTKKLQNQIDKAAEAIRDGEYYLNDISAFCGKNVLNEIYDKLISLHLAISSAGSTLNFTRIKGNRTAENAIQKYFEVLKEFKDISWILYYDGDDPNADITFYNAYNELMKEINNYVKAQNPIRNYIIKKPHDIKKEHPTYLGLMQRMENQWWTGEKFEKKHFSILQRDGKYYYFILTGDGKNFVPDSPLPGDDYYLMRSQIKPAKGASMVLPKLIFCTKPVAAKKYFEENPNSDSLTVTEGFNTPFTITKDKYNLYLSGKFKKGVGTVDDARAMMRLYERFINSNKNYECYDFSSVKDPDEYEFYNDYCLDIDKCSLAVQDIPVSADQIDTIVDEGNGLLFLIYNRNLYNTNKKKDHYAGLFIQALSERNQKESIVQLNSRPTIMYRPALLDASMQPTHKKGSWLLNKIDANGDPIPSDIYEELYKFKNMMSASLSKDAKSYIDSNLAVFKKADGNIIKDKRYTKEQYTLIMSYVMNKKASKKTASGIALDKLNSRIDSDNNGNILSIARGTQDLIYYTVIDKDGKILDEKSLNVIDKYDYMKKLKQISKIRNNEKRSWQNETTVKDLKDGYCRRAITEIVNDVVKYDVTTILCERISDSFKDKYSCIDNQLFKGFEKKLSARLANLKSRDKDPYDVGGIMNPVQLCDDSGNAFRDGILSYVPNSYITNMDPECGFYPLFKKGNIKSTVQKRDFFAKFKEIMVHNDNISLTFNYGDFDVNAETNKKDWTVTINGKCFEYDREHKCYTELEDMPEFIMHKIQTAKPGDDLTKIIYDIPAAGVDALWKYFNIAIYGQGRDEERKMYVSPVTDKCTLKAHNAAILQSKKFEAMKNCTKKKPEDIKSYWLDTMQA